jgi:hypothetical protein
MTISRNSHYSTPEIQGVGNLELHTTCVYSICHNYISQVLRVYTVVWIRYLFFWEATMHHGVFGSRHFQTSMLSHNCKKQIPSDALSYLRRTDTSTFHKSATQVLYIHTTKTKHLTSEHMLHRRHHLHFWKPNK